MDDGQEQSALQVGRGQDGAWQRIPLFHQAVVLTADTVRICIQILAWSSSAAGR